VWLLTYIHTYLYFSKTKHIHQFKYTNTNIYLQVCTHTTLYLSHMHTNIYACSPLCMHTHTHICTHLLALPHTHAHLHAIFFKNTKAEVHILFLPFLIRGHTMSCKHRLQCTCMHAHACTVKLLLLPCICKQYVYSQLLSLWNLQQSISLLSNTYADLSVEGEDTFWQNVLAMPARKLMLFYANMVTERKK